MKFSPSEFQNASDAYHKKWEASDKALYELCKLYRDHQDCGGVHAKLLVIGRTYQTGIERKIKSGGTQGSSMEQLADYIWENRNAVDGILDGVRSLKEPLNLDQLGKILIAHGQLVTLVEGVLREGQTPRSFVSKYLHFHNSAFPIYDSVVVGALRKFYRNKRGDEQLPIPAGADEQYRVFVWQFWTLYQEAKQSQAEVSVKLLDNYLLVLSREKPEQRPAEVFLEGRASAEPGR